MVASQMANPSVDLKVFKQPIYILELKEVKSYTMKHITESRLYKIIIKSIT